MRTAAGALVLSVVFSALVLFLLPKFLPRTMNISTRGVVVLVVAVAITAIVWVGSFWLRNIRVIVGPDTVEIGRPGATEVYPRATTVFGSKITEHRTNGLPSGTTRALAVHTGTRETVIELPGFTRSTFNELMALLRPAAQPLADDPVEAARARASLPSAFTVDVSGERRFARTLLIGAVVLVLVAVVTVLLVLTPAFVEADLQGLVLLAPFAVVGAVGLGIGALQRYRLVRAIPSRVSISHHGLRLDDVDHPYDQLARIWVTPPGYPVRRLRLDRRAGRSLTCVLGSSRVLMTPDYAEFVTALRAETARMPGLLSLDLE